MNQREMFGWSLSLTPGAVAQPRTSRRAVESLDLFAAPEPATEVQTEAPVAVDRSAAARTISMFDGS